MKKICCTACGDAMIFRHLPGEYDGFARVRDFIARGDFRFVNLETTVHNFETFAAARSGGSWFCTEPSVLEDVKAFGFNMLSTANNHATDYGYTGVTKTLDYIKAAGLNSCGTGNSLAEAAAPIYLDTLQGRIALIGATSTFHPESMAGEQTNSLPGRPGVNGIRHSTVYQMPKAQMEQLRSIADAMQINLPNEIHRQQGYLPPLPENELEFGDLRFTVSDRFAVQTLLNDADLARVQRSIREARFMADYVVIAMHSHEIKGADDTAPADFYAAFAHACIDAGANAVIGTGVHFLRPIEIYRNCPIFYSLGDFIIQLETIRKAPADFYATQNMTGSEGLDALFRARSGDGKKGLYYNPRMFRSVIPYWEAEDGKLTALQLLPIELAFDAPRSMGGWPHYAQDQGILEHLAEISRPYGTKITIENGMASVVLGE